MERFKGYSKSQINRCIDEWVIGQNAVRNREILKKKLIDGVSYTTLSAEYDLCPKRIETIVKKGVETIIVHL